ncbi:hypothetical protein M758_4G153800 [Ceratodon purpureus]|uniref:VQ domain-containing protein n=1 Tax=Ceratodon purpureus TaxID=3225 RepID=A0A8T0IB48_CERPU|nr:hypothetical protein KC19_4G153000 [Ceratodon purpureus]KAG0619634.1 hypothetical protein M758_4G153800 [Ceratodon purpureus]
MGAIEAHVNASKPTPLKSTGLQLNKSGPVITKPRVIHTYSPRVYKIQPEEFLELVQKLTGKTVAQPKRLTTIQFFETDSFKTGSKSGNSRSQETPVASSNVGDFANSGEALASPYTRNLLGALPSPRLVTLNFLPLLTTPRAQTN